MVDEEKGSRRSKNAPTRRNLTSVGEAISLPPFSRSPKNRGAEDVAPYKKGSTMVGAPPSKLGMCAPAVLPFSRSPFPRSPSFLILHYSFFILHYSFAREPGAPSVELAQRSPPTGCG